MVCFEVHGYAGALTSANYNVFTAAWRLPATAAEGGHQCGWPFGEVSI